MQQLNKANTVLLELGVGFNTPTIIKYPFENITVKSENTTLVRINKDYPKVSKVNADNTIAFEKDISLVIQDLL